MWFESMNFSTHNYYTLNWNKMKKPKKFSKVPNGQLEKDGYSKYPESENIYNKFDKNSKYILKILPKI